MRARREPREFPPALAVAGALVFSLMAITLPLSTSTFPAAVRVLLALGCAGVALWWIVLLVRQRRRR